MDAAPLAEAFEARRARLHAIAYRMLGSLTEAEDAVQEAWLRVSRPDLDPVRNLDAWLATVVARVCLNMLRARRARAEEPFGVRLPDPIVTAEADERPEERALVSDAVGFALLVVLETLTAAERLAFVLHDVFELPYAQIATIVDRSEDATRQLASRARRRVRQAAPRPGDLDRSRQRAVVDAFFAAAQGRDAEALLAVLDPDVILRSDGGRRRPQLTLTVRGAGAVSRYAVPVPHSEIVPVRVNGAAGALILVGGSPFSIMAFTVRGGRVAEIDGIVDPDRVGRLAAGVLGTS